jgi:hypothetical protein
MAHRWLKKIKEKEKKKKQLKDTDELKEKNRYINASRKSFRHRDTPRVRSELATHLHRWL